MGHIHVEAGYSVMMGPATTGNTNESQALISITVLSILDLNMCIISYFILTVFWLISSRGIRFEGFTTKNYVILQDSNFY